MSANATTAVDTEMEALFAGKRLAMRNQFLDNQFQLGGGFLGGTDTYKRTMWTAVPDIAVMKAAYHLTFRRPLAETGAGKQLIMAGHEAMLAQWFRRPLKRKDIELSALWSKQRSTVRAFPQQLWDKILGSQSGDDIYMPVDVWGFPGGQSFVTGVPALTFEGMGGAISYLEPAMCRYFQPVIQATKARLMKLATSQDAELGLRSAPSEATHLIMLLARYVGGGGVLTSNDTAEFMWPELFKTIGTIGHEMMCSNQSLDRTLSDAEHEMMDRFVTAMGSAYLLCDLVDAKTVGLRNALRVIKDHPEATNVGVRIDSGNISEQCVLYFNSMRAKGIKPRTIVFEDEVTPDTVRTVCENFRKETGEEPTVLFPGAGGYWWRLVYRDSVSPAFKRSATEDRPNLKFSNSPGKESLPGYLRVYAQGDTMIVADSSETVDGEPLFVKLVDQGKIVYDESFQVQAARAAASWGKYKQFKLSDKVRTWQEKYQQMRADEIKAAAEAA